MRLQRINQGPCPLHPYQLKVKYKSSSHKWYIKGDKLCLSFYLEYDHRADGICVAYCVAVVYSNRS